MCNRNDLNGLNGLNYMLFCGTLVSVLLCCVVPCCILLSCIVLFVRASVGECV